jgi:peptidoglycan lytic transglycosylase
MEVFSSVEEEVAHDRFIMHSREPLVRSRQALTSFPAWVIVSRMKIHCSVQKLFMGMFLFLTVVSLACNFPQPGSSIPPAATRTPSPPPPSATPTITPTPPPTPTPIPAVRVDNGDKALQNGDWENAIKEYQSALDASPDPDIQSAALLGIGRSRMIAGDYQAAVDILLKLTQSYPKSPHMPYAFFNLGQAYSALDQHSQAADAYLNYLALRPGVVDAYVMELRGDELVAAGDFAGAIRDFRAALQAPSFLNGLLLEIKIAKAHAAVGDYDTALGMYQDISTRAQTDYTKAQMDYFSGQAFAATGQMDKAYAAYQDAVNQFPAVDSAYLSLLELVNAGVSVDELSRGVVDYYAGQYGVARAAFDRYFQSGGPEPDKARYFNGLTLRALGNYSAAVEEFDKVIQNYADSPYWDKAWEQKAYTQWYFMKDTANGIQTLKGFVSAAPNHPRAGEFLFDAAQVAEDDGQLPQAAELWERVATEYPGYEQAQRALLLAGVTRYRMADYTSALAIFQRYLDNSETLEDKATANFWLGKTHFAQGDAPLGTLSMQTAANIDPTGYYSERANDILRQRQPFTPPQNMDLTFDLATERQEADVWMRSTFSLTVDTDLSTPGPLLSDSRLIRGTELWQLGLYDDARTEFEDLRQAVASDPANSYRLANYLLQMGFYRSAIRTARQVLDLAGMSDVQTINAPIYFNHIRFGTYFSDLILPAAHQYNIHPLLLFSIVRQESAFDGFASSSAGAQGLMQIVPATGQEIATGLDWPPGYREADLYRPIVNIVLGTDYLAKWRDYFDGDMYSALAAYNGGPGNAMEWKQKANNDPDVFLEVINLEETRNYIRGIYEIFNLYRRIYDRTP